VIKLRPYEKMHAPINAVAKVVTIIVSFLNSPFLVNLKKPTIPKKTDKNTLIEIGTVNGASIRIATQTPRIAPVIETLHFFKYILTKIAAITPNTIDPIVTPIMTPI
jgi:hypothetical protein